MRALRRSPETAVCPQCGAGVGDNESCEACGEDLRAYEKLPLRSDWADDARDAIAVAEPPAEPVDLNPVSLGLALLGAALIIVALFLPVNQGATENNTLIQQGLTVWTVVIFGALFVVALAWAHQRRARPTWGMLLFPVTVAATTIHLLKGATLYPVVNGRPDAHLPGVHAPAGAGVYAVLVGAALCGIGIVALRLQPERRGP